MSDRKLPDKAIDVIDEAGASQYLLPVSSRKKIITSKEIEAVVALIARIPTKSISSNDKEGLKNLERDLKNVERKNVRKKRKHRDMNCKWIEDKNRI